MTLQVTAVNNLQWAILIFLGALVVLMYRQLAFYSHLREGQHQRNGIPVGDAFPSFGYVIANGGSRGKSAEWSAGAPTLFLFGEPGCASCDRALSALEAVSAGSEVGVLVVTDSSLGVCQAASSYRDSRLSVASIPKEVMRRQLNVVGTPLLIAVDPSGKVTTRTSTDSAKEIRRLLHPRLTQEPQQLTESSADVIDAHTVAANARR